jgi:type II restriction enzyme
MKAFRAIRQCVRATVENISSGTFGNDFKGSPLEFVLTAITEQRQMLEGAAHSPNRQSGGMSATFNYPHMAK